MKKIHYLLMATAATGLFWACKPKSAAKVTELEGKNTVTPAGKRKFIDVANMNMAVKPSEDFYEYANGAWLKNTPIPASESRWGSFNELQEFNQTALKTILEELSQKQFAKGTIEQKVADFYTAGMDEAAIEKAGMSPLKPYLDRVDNIKGVNSLFEEIGRMKSEGSNVLFAFYVDQDDKNSTQLIPKIYQGGLHLPDRDYYTSTDERSTKIRQAYEQHANNVFRLMGFDAVKAQANAGDVMRIETALAKASLTRVEQRDPQKLYNKMSIKGLDTYCPIVDWKTMMKTMGVKSDSVIVGMPKFLEGLNELVKTEKLDDWKTYLKWCIVKENLGLLNAAMVSEGFEFSKNLSGQKEIQPRWKRVSTNADNLLGEALGQIYVDRNFKPEAKQRMLTLVGNLIKTYEKRIKGLDWMSEATKQQALRKMGSFAIKIGYPDKWTDYSSVTIGKNSYFENVIACEKFGFKKMVDKLGKPLDRSVWLMSPPTVNAYYNPPMNEIVFPAGILRFPFFDNDADDAINYGGIGAVIGHELTHGFDDEGRQFDFEGNLKEWWTEDDAKKFTAKADKVVAQYDAYTVLDGKTHVNGKLTLGENLADFGGLSLAYEAFKTYTEQGKNDKDKIDGFTGDQRLFLSWAQVWRANIRDEAMAQRIITDPHSPGRFRCNGPISNMTEFYNAFGVKKGDKMWREAGDRAKVW